MIGDGISMGRTAGNVIALISSLSFAVMLVLARRSRREDVLGGTFLGGAMALVAGGVAAACLATALPSPPPICC